MGPGIPAITSNMRSCGSGLQAQTQTRTGLPNRKNSVKTVLKPSSWLNSFVTNARWSVSLETTCCQESPEQVHVYMPECPSASKSRDRMLVSLCQIEITFPGSFLSTFHSPSLWECRCRGWTQGPLVLHHPPVPWEVKGRACDWVQSLKVISMQHKNSKGSRPRQWL